MMGGLTEDSIKDAELAWINGLIETQDYMTDVNPMEQFTHKCGSYIIACIPRSCLGEAEDH